MKGAHANRDVSAGQNGNFNRLDGRRSRQDYVSTSHIRDLVVDASPNLSAAPWFNKRDRRLIYYSLGEA